MLVSRINLCLQSFLCVAKTNGLFDVWFFQTQVFLFVDNFENKTNQQCSQAQACEHYERPRVVIGHRGLLLCHGASCQILGNLRISSVKNLANQNWEQPQTDVLNPENQRVGTTDDFFRNELWHTWPQSCRHE